MNRWRAADAAAKATVQSRNHCVILSATKNPAVRQFTAGPQFEKDIMQRIAFFGGSFDPPHRGHLAIAKAAADHFALDQVLFAPVANQPLKTNSPAASFFDRYAMTALATQADSRFVPSLLDSLPDHGDGSRPNYTVETLERLRSSLRAQSALFTLLGADSWLDIARWHEAGRMLALSDWIVAARPGFSLAAAERALPTQIAVEQVQSTLDHFLQLNHHDGSRSRVFFLTTLWEDISASELRRSLATGHAPADCLPAAVEAYIHKTGIYADTSV